MSRAFDERCVKAESKGNRRRQCRKRADESCRRRQHRKPDQNQQPVFVLRTVGTLPSGAVSLNGGVPAFGVTRGETSVNVSNDQIGTLNGTLMDGKSAARRPGNFE